MKTFVYLSFGSLLILAAACKEEESTSTATTESNSTALTGACFDGLSDRTGDGKVDVADCRGDTGRQGDAGPQGAPGPSPQPQQIMRFSAAQIATILMTTANPNGVQNSTGRVIFVHGRVQLFNSKTNCKSANLEIQQAGQALWSQLQVFYIEGINTQNGTGMSFPVTFYLAPGARFRVRENVNASCTSGSLYLGGAAESGLPEAQIMDWSFIPL